MASIETGNISTAQPNLHTQDLSTLNVATLTPLSPEVISRQATINIGTIGHVAHGKSTVVKAISGVQTVRFKNELERNITIKLERLMFGPDGKVIQPKSELQPDRMKSERAKPERAKSEGAQTKRTQRVAIRRSLRQQLVPYQLNERRAVRKCTLVPLLSPLSSLKPSSSSSSTSTSSSRSSPTSLKSSPTTAASKGTTYKREYVVERILAHDVRRNKQLFLVKWQGWSEDYNSWEPLEHLTNCDRLLEDFFADSLQQPVLDELQRWLDIRPASLTELNELLPSRGGVRALPPRSYVQRELMAIAATPVDKRNGALRDKCRHALFTYWALVQRDKQLISLRAWEQHMNKVAVEDAELRVVNDVDLEGAPEGFVYVNNYIAGEGVFIPDDPPIGCECQRCDGRAQFCCWDQSQFGYRRRGRVNVPQGTPIYECNRRCVCKPETCTNRVVQRGRHIPLCIFRTRDGRGWGVRALRRVYSGEFVCEYVGEVVSFEEAERRGRGYDAQGRTYLFDLDFNSHDFPYTVDAATYGNVSHFINHSCEPNLGVWAVWVDCLDPNLPRLALFATRDIAKDEEITFDYMCNDVRTKNASTPTSNRTRLAVATPDDDNENIRPQCKCGARTCRRYLF